MSPSRRLTVLSAAASLALSMDCGAASATDRARSDKLVWKDLEGRVVAQAIRHVDPDKSRYRSELAVDTPGGNRAFVEHRFDEFDGATVLSFRDESTGWHADLRLEMIPMSGSVPLDVQTWASMTDQGALMENTILSCCDGRISEVIGSDKLKPADLWARVREQIRGEGGLVFPREVRDEVAFLAGLLRSNPRGMVAAYEPLVNVLHDLISETTKSPAEQPQLLEDSVPLGEADRGLVETLRKTAEKGEKAPPES